MLCSDWPSLCHMTTMEGRTSPHLNHMDWEWGRGDVSKGNVGCCYQTGKWWSAGKNNRCPLHTQTQAGLNAQFHLQNQVSCGDFCYIRFFSSNKLWTLEHTLCPSLPSNSSTPLYERLDTLEIFMSYFLNEWSDTVINLWKPNGVISSVKGSVVERQKERRC